MTFRIENEYLRVDALSLGGCLSSIYDKQAQDEILYQPEPDSWQGQDVAIFPFVARLKNKEYSYQGQRYSLRNHGLCRYYEFALEEKEEEAMRLAFSSNDETFREYPFPFHFEICYRLHEKTLDVCYEVTNTGEETLPFGIGAHPAFRLLNKASEGVMDTSGNRLEWDKPISLTRICFDEKGELVVGEEDFGSRQSVDIDKRLFQQYKTLCLAGEGISDATLVRLDGKRIRFHYDNIHYFVLWSFPETGAFVAIEPWMSLPDYLDAEMDIRKKKTLLHLPAGARFAFSYSITLP